MNRLFRSSLQLALAGLTCAAVSAQIQTVATEPFDYTPVPTSFNGQAGGTGFKYTNWFVSNVNDMEATDNSIAMPPFNLAGPLNPFATTLVRDGACYRVVDRAPHVDVTTNVGGVDLFGRDGSVIWISFSAVRYAGTGTQGEHYGGMSIYQQGCCEVMFLGSPWDTNGWGIDDEGPNGAAPAIAPGSDNLVETRLVYRIDHMPGQERLRMWLNPAVPHPNGPADLDTMIAEMQWQEVSFKSGGNAGQLFYFDDLVIEKGESGSLGTTYCSPAVNNSTGAPATISATGSDVAAQNNLTLVADSLPNNSFGFFLTSATAGLVMNPGGSQGNLCLSGAIGRYVGAGQIKNSGATGMFDLPLDLTQTPTPTGLISVVAGQTRRYQGWYRDAIGGQATSNFTDGIEILYQ